MPSNPFVARNVDEDTIIIIYTDPKTKAVSRIEFPCNKTWETIVDMFNLSDGR